MTIKTTLTWLKSTEFSPPTDIDILIVNKLGNLDLVRKDYHEEWHSLADDFYKLEDIKYWAFPPELPECEEWPS